MHGVANFCAASGEIGGERIGLDCTRQHSIHTNAWCEFGGHQLGEVRFRILCEAMGQRPPQRVLTGHRTDVDDRCVVALKQVRRGEAHKLEWHRHIEVKRLLDLVDGGVEERLGNRTAGIVDDDVESAELCDRAVDDVREFAEVIYVSGKHQRSTAECLNFGSYGFKVGFGTGREHNVSTGSSEGCGDCRADAFAGAGDDCDLIGQQESVGELSVRSHGDNVRAALPLC